MNDLAANRKLLLGFAILGASWLLIVQPGSRWSGSIQISSVRIVVSLQSDTVRFRTQSSGNGHSLFKIGDDAL